MNNISQPIMERGTIEFYAHNGAAYALIDGVQLPIDQWPVRVAEMVRRDLDRHPGAESALERMGISDPVKMLNQYVMCMYGELNNNPDFINYSPSKSDAEFTQLICGAQNCSFRGILCQLIHADCGGLSDREVEICRLLAQGYTSQVIAYRLGISPHTVNTHITNILPKIGVANSKAVAAWSAQHLNP